MVKRVAASTSGQYRLIPGAIAGAGALLVVDVETGVEGKGTAGGWRWLGHGAGLRWRWRSRRSASVRELKGDREEEMGNRGGDGQIYYRHLDVAHQGTVRHT